MPLDVPCDQKSGSVTVAQLQKYVKSKLGMPPCQKALRLMVDGREIKQNASTCQLKSNMVITVLCPGLLGGSKQPPAADKDDHFFRADSKKM